MGVVGVEEEGGGGVPRKVGKMGREEKEPGRMMWIALSLSLSVLWLSAHQCQTAFGWEAEPSDWVQAKPSTERVPQVLRRYLWSTSTSTGEHGLRLALKQGGK